MAFGFNYPVSFSACLNLTELAELAACFHGTKFSTLLGSQLGDPKSSN